MQKAKKTRGEYVIYVDDNEVYSTDSLFWYRFFTGNRIENDVKLGEATNWDVITCNGKVIYEFKTEIKK